MSCLFEHLIGVIEQDQAMGDEKSPENMADNDAEADTDEVRQSCCVNPEGVKGV